MFVIQTEHLKANRDEETRRVSSCLIHNSCRVFPSLGYSRSGGVWGNEGAVHALRRGLLAGLCAQRQGEVSLPFGDFTLFSIGNVTLCHLHTARRDERRP